MSKFISDRHLEILYTRMPRAVPLSEFPRLIRHIRARHNREVAAVCRQMSLRLAERAIPPTAH